MTTPHSHSQSYSATPTVSPLPSLGLRASVLAWRYEASLGPPEAGAWQQHLLLYFTSIIMKGIYRMLFFKKFSPPGRKSLLSHKEE